MFTFKIILPALRADGFNADNSIQTIEADSYGVAEGILDFYLKGDKIASFDRWTGVTRVPVDPVKSA